MANTTVKLKAKTKSKTKVKAKPTQKAKNKSLLIVESPTKVKKLKKFIGKDFVVMASVGHLKICLRVNLGLM